MHNPTDRGDHKKRSTLVVGRRSLLAQALLAADVPSPVHVVGHDEDIQSHLDGVDCIVNFALNPAYRNQPYDERFDFDLQLACAIADRPIHYILLSSRKVYTLDAQWEATEASAVGPVDEYGKNKLTTERRLTELLGDRLMILRIANVIGDEQKLRRSFMSLVMNGLAQNQTVTLDISSATRRDFIPDSAFGKILARILEKPVSGVMNVGSGLALPVGNIAEWVIEGYGKGAIEVVDPQVRDEFVLNVDRLTSHYGPVCSEDDIHRHCIEIGREIEPA